MMTGWDIGMIGGVLVALLCGGGALLARAFRAQGVTIQGVLERAVEVRGDLTPDLDAQSGARFAQIERRMEILEQDALSYLRKGSQRYEQSRRREARLNETVDDEPEGVSDADREQLELAIGTGAAAVDSNGITSLDDIRARM